MFIGCQTSIEKKIPREEPVKNVVDTPESVRVITDTTAGDILSRRQVPILCYHQIRDFRGGDSKTARDYIVPPARFREQMQLLADSGYNTILPDQLIQYLKYGTALPPKPVMLSFDDSDLSQFEVAKAELDKHRFKGVFFIMTVVLNKPGYMRSEHVKQLAEEGHVIASHSWDHKNTRKFTEEDWAVQIDKPSKQLSQITGRPVGYFAYPFGLWNHEAAQGLADRGFKGAFQLSAKRDSTLPLMTIRRIIIPGEWAAEKMHAFMKQSFR